MGNGNATPTLVATLNEAKDEGVKEAAAEKLCNKIKQFGDHSEYIKAVGSHAGKSLVEMLKSGTPRGKTHAAGTLSFLVRNSDCKEKIVEFGAIPLFVQLLKEDNDYHQRAAVAALIANLASGNPGNQAALADAGAIPLLVEIVKSGHSEARGWAASALGNMSLQHPKNQSLVGEAGGILAIVELLQSHKEYVPPLTTKASIMSCSACRKRAPPHSKNSEQATRAMSALAFNHADNQAKILEAGGVEALVRVAKEGSPGDETEAVAAIGFVWGKDPQSSVKARLLDSEGVRVLIEMVQNSADDAKAQAATLLARLAHADPNAQSAIATCGAITILVEVANKSTHVSSKISAVQALKELTTDNADNKKLLEEAGGEPLVNRLMNTGMKFRELSEEDQLRMQKGEVKFEAETEEDVNKPLVAAAD